MQKIIIDVGLSNDKLLNELDGLTYSIELLKQEQIDLTKSYKLGNLTTAEYIKQTRESKEQIDDLTKQKKTLITTQTAEVNSIKGLKAQYSLLNEEYQNIDLSTKEGIKRSQELQTQMSDLSDTINDAQKASGNFTSNIGRYADGVREGIMQTDVFGVSLKDISLGFKTFYSGVVNASSSLNLFKVALIGTGIGAFVVLLGTLISYFTSTQEGADKFGQIMAKLGAILKPVLDIINYIGAGVATFVEGLVDAIAYVGDIINTAASFVGIKVADPKDTKTLKQQADEAARIVKNRQQLELVNKKLITQAEKEFALQEDLKNIRDDENVALEQRLLANDKLFGSIKREFEYREKAQDNVINQLNDELKIMGDKNGKTEKLLELEDAKAEKFKLEQDRLGKVNEQLTNRVSIQREINDLMIENQALNFEIMKIQGSIRTGDELDLANRKLLAQQKANAALSVFIENTAIAIRQQEKLDAQTKLTQEILISERIQTKKTTTTGGGNVLSEDEALKLFEAKRDEVRKKALEDFVNDRQAKDIIDMITIDKLKSESNYKALLQEFNIKFKDSLFSEESYAIKYAEQLRAEVKKIEELKQKSNNKLSKTEEEELTNTLKNIDELRAKVNTASKNFYELEEKEKQKYIDRANAQTATSAQRTKIALDYQLEETQAYADRFAKLDKDELEKLQIRIKQKESLLETLSKTDWDYLATQKELIDLRKEVEKRGIASEEGLIFNVKEPTDKDIEDFFKNTTGMDDVKLAQFVSGFLRNSTNKEAVNDFMRGFKDSLRVRSLEMKKVEDEFIKNRAITQIQNRLDENNLLVKRFRELDNERIDAERRNLIDQANLNIVNLEGTEKELQEQRNKILKDLDVDLENFDKNIAEKRLQYEVSLNQMKLGFLKTYNSEYLTQTKALLESEYKLRLKSAKSQEEIDLIKSDYNRKSFEAEANDALAKEQFIVDAASMTAEAISQLKAYSAEDVLLIDQALTLALQQNQIDQFSMAGQVAQGLSQIAGEQTAIGKALAITAITIDTISQSAKAFNQASVYASNPLTAPLAVNAGIQGGLIIAKGAANIAAITAINPADIAGANAFVKSISTIQSGTSNLGSSGKKISAIKLKQKELKLATGGFVSGSGTSTSDSIPAYLSNGESVINARSTSAFKPLLSAINEIGGGKKFDDSFTNTNIKSIKRDYNNNQQIINSMKNIQPIVTVKDINKAQNRVNVKEQANRL